MNEIPNIPDAAKANPIPGVGFAHEFNCTHDPCRCRGVVEWDQRWPHEKSWDEFTELVSTMTDEVMPTKIEPARDFMRDLAVDVVLWICSDGDMRNLAYELLDAATPDGLDRALDLDDESIDQVCDSENVILMKALVYKLWRRLRNQGTSPGGNGLEHVQDNER